MYYMCFKEEFLHFLWANRSLPMEALRDCSGRRIRVLDPGRLNGDAGPDFLFARIALGHTLWAGHVEMHLKASQWREHGHHQDRAYDNVILHVVWRNDQPVSYAEGGIMPTLELCNLVSLDYISRYRRLYRRKRNGINCSRINAEVTPAIWEGWLADLYRLRLHRKYTAILEADRMLQGHWEALLFHSVFRYMGSRVNADAFAAIAREIGWEVVQRVRAAEEDMEALFLGVAGLLPGNPADTWQRKKSEEYRFLSKKYRLRSSPATLPVFFRLRPDGFPTLRLSQLAGLYSNNNGLFSAVLQCVDLKSLESQLQAEASPYWDDRYGFAKTAVRTYRKKISRARIQLLILNAVLPLLYAYAEESGKPLKTDAELLVRTMPAEENSVVEKMQQEGVPVVHSGHSQAVQELYHHYCAKNQCLQCRIGRLIIEG